MLRVRTTFTGPSSPSVATHHFVLASPTQTLAEAAGTAVKTFWNTARLYIADNFTYTVEAEIEIIDPTTGLQTGSFFQTPTSAIGQDANDELPFQTQGLVNWRTGTFVGGREIRGRTFIPGPTEARSSGGVPDTTYLTNLQSAASALVGTSTYQFGVWSREHSLVSQATAGVAVSGWRVLRSRR